METKAALCAAVLEVLDKNNYEDWSVRIRTYLKAQDLWNIVDTTTEPPTEEDDEATFKAWEKKDSMALHVIQISCGSDAFSEIRKSISAKDAWDTLKGTYGPKTTVSGMDNYKSNDYGEYDDLSKALQSGELYAAREFFILRPNAVNEKITVLGQTALHIAVAARHLHIVNELIELMWDKALEIKDDQGNTALFEALFIGNCDMAKRMLNKNKNLVSIENKSKILPVVMAIQFGYTELAEQLYSLTSLDLLTPEKGVNGATLCTQAIYTRNLGIALDLIERCPRLALALDRENCSPLYALSAIPYAFPSGEPPVFWKRWIYYCTRIPSAGATNEIRLDSEKEEKRQNDQAKPIGLGTRIPSAGATNEVSLEIGKEEKRQNDQAKPIGSVLLAPLRQLVSNLHNFFGIEHLHKMESVHTRCHKLLLRMCKEISRSNTQERKKGCVDKAIFCAIKNGNFEFLFHIVKANSDLLRCSDRESRNIFLHAVLHRQAKIFSLLYGLEEKNVMIYDSDVYGNFILHMAGMSEASTLLNRISGPALEMQRELQWFKEVESIVHPKVTEAVNKDGLTPRELFTKNHKELKQLGEQWMKGTATSCTVVAALIVTIMFAAAFTVPGGNDEKTGFPMFVHKRLFMAFIISDALSLFSSSTSVLMFLGILTSRYAEEDFLKSLPRKMIIGLFTLFFSITTMVIAFSTALLNMLPGKSWLVFFVICFALLPVATFLFMQISLLVVMCKSTFRPNIFHRKMKSWV